MRSVILGALSALVLSCSAGAEPLTGADIALTLGGKMLAGDDDRTYRFYANGLLEITDGNEADSTVQNGTKPPKLGASFGQWSVSSRYLRLQFPGKDESESSLYQLDVAETADEASAARVASEAPLSLVMTPLGPGPRLSGRLNSPSTIRLQREAEAGEDLGTLPDIVSVLKPVPPATAEKP